MALVPMTRAPFLSALKTALPVAFLIAVLAAPTERLSAQANPGQPAAKPPAAPAAPTAPTAPGQTAAGQTAPGQPAAKASAPSPLDKPVFDAIKKYREGDAAGALAILEPHKKEIAEIRPLASVLGAIYVDAGKPQQGFDLLAPLAAKEDADAPILYNAGRAALALGKTTDARNYLMRSVAIEPASPASRELGMLLAREGKVVEAYRSLRPWSIRSPRDSEARLTAAVLALGLERPFEAEELLAGQPEADPAIRLLRAKVAIQKGDGPAAIALLQPIAGKHPEAMDLEIRRTQAEAYLLADSPAEAIPLLQGKASSPAVALLLARAQRQTKNIAAALATLQPFAEKLPTDPKNVGDPRPASAIASEYGQILAAQGKTPEALGYLERATQLNPLSPEAFAAYADTLKAAGRADQAKIAQAHAKELADGRDQTRQIAEQAARELRDALAAPPPSAAAPGASAAGAPAAGAAPPPALSTELQEALRAMSSGDRTKALNLVRQRIKAAPDDLVARNLEVRILMGDQRFAEALAAAEAARRQAPDNADMVYQQAAIEMAMKRLTEAELDFRRAIALAPNHVAALSDLAVLLTVQGKKPEAEKLLRKVLEINPRDTHARENLDRLYKEE
ncbi:MAG TPA: tetratricopeptide repeat protein [Thermoanaerobaculia bacterium]|jgi:Flp pilus assembly protein TadD|nr:tetratricopeptide repeat protein [Thermoanaerobaculia bacterium]